VCFYKGIKVNELQLTQDVMNEIARDFSFSGEIQPNSRGRRLNEIENSKELTVAYRCLETTLLLIKRMQAKGLSPTIIQWKQKPFWYWHFDVGFYHEKQLYVANFENNKILKINEYQQQFPHYFSPKLIPAKAMDSQRLFELLDRQTKLRWEAKAALARFRPRLWRTRNNKKKNQEKALNLNDKVKAAYK